MPRSDAVLDHLRTRRSVPAVTLREPGPGVEELGDILTIASRVPDHGKLAPWRFVVMAGSDLSSFLERLVGFWQQDNPDASPEALAVERGKRPVAPVMVVLVSRAGEHAKIPLWEQELAVGAAGLNLLHAVYGHGYAGQWLSGWPAYDPKVADLLGLAEGERVAGFFYLGSTDQAPSDRDRPDIAALTSRWSAPDAG